MPKLRLIITALLLTALYGCSSVSMKLSQSDKNNITSVYIPAPKITAAKMYYMGPGAALLYGLGPVAGSLAATQASKGPGSTLLYYAKSKGITIEDIVKESVIEKLHQDRIFKVSDTKENSDAFLEIEIPHYGFTVSNGFSSTVIPVLKYTCRLKNASNQVIWEATQSIGIFGNDIEGFKPASTVANPNLISASWKQAADEIAAEIIPTLK